MRAALLTLLGLLVLTATACSDDTQNKIDARRTGDGTSTIGDGKITSGDGPAGKADGFVPADCSGCGAGKGCIVVTVTRSTDDSKQPWKVWPDKADGVGTLIVSALQATTTVSRKTVQNADFKPATAKYIVELGCVPTGTLQVGAFLDDNGNAVATATSSSDYIDSCPATPRQKDVIVSAGQISNLDLPLNNSCD